MAEEPENAKARRRKRIWVQDVDVSVRALETRLDVALARGLSPEQQQVAHGVRRMLRSAHQAANRVDPIPGRWVNWARGILPEAAFRNLHAARAQMVDLYDEPELAAEVPTALAHAFTILDRDDPRCVSRQDLEAMPLPMRRATVRLLIEHAYSEQDRSHARLRSFRNIVLLAAAGIALLLLVAVVAVSLTPTVLPLCFPNEVTSAEGVTAQHNLNCPTRTDTPAPTGGDVLVVALVGLLGGSLTAALSIRNLRGTSTPYDVPVALAMLKVPLGAFIAILGLVAIQGDFVPGLSVLDSQGQILAYALVFGFAQQAVTRVLDKQANALASGIPNTEQSSPPPASRGAEAPPGGPASPQTSGIPPEPAAVGVGALAGGETIPDKP